MKKPSYVIQMTKEQWWSVPDHHCQRNTEQHVKTARRYLCDTDLRLFADVEAVVYPDGSLEKLDGHTRAAAQQAGFVEGPNRYIVTVFPVDSREESKEMYHQRDNSRARKTNKDSLFSACKAMGIHLHSDYMKRCSWTQGLKWAEMGLSGAHAHGSNSFARLQEMVDEWRDEIQILDEVLCEADHPKDLVAHVIGILFLTLRRNKREISEIKDFVREYLGLKECSSFSPANVYRLYVVDNHRDKEAKEKLIPNGMKCIEFHLRHPGKPFRRRFKKSDWRGKGVFTIDGYLKASNNSICRGIK